MWFWTTQVLFIDKWYLVCYIQVPVIEYFCVSVNIYVNKKNLSHEFFVLLTLFKMLEYVNHFWTRVTFSFCFCCLKDLFPLFWLVRCCLQCYINKQSFPLCLWRLYISYNVDTVIKTTGLPLSLVGKDLIMLSMGHEFESQAGHSTETNFPEKKDFCTFKLVFFLWRKV